MKNRIFIFISLFTLLLTSCIIIVGTITSGIEKYTISFDSDGGSIVKEQIVEEGQFIIEPKDPIKENFKFICWEYNNERYDFNTPVKSNITLFAKWEEVTIDIHEHNYKEEVFNSTCTEYGYTLYTCECGDTYKDNFLTTLEHSLIYHEKVEPTCTEIGCEEYVECTKCTYSTYKEINALGHDKVFHEKKEPTESEIGWEEFETCTRCSYSTYVELPATGVTSIEIYEKDGKKFFNFGSYPQSHIDDINLINELNKLTTVNSRGYYEYENEEYFKVTTKPYHTGSRYTYSTGKPILNDVTEWFKVEPIVWRILSSNNNTYFVLSEYILDQHLYYNNSSVRIIDGQTIYINNYEYSDIRKFLNDQFFNTAFKASEQAFILVSEVDNSASTTFSSGNKYICENTFDKIYLLSWKDTLNTTYGFSSDHNVNDEEKIAIVTDYAKAVGVVWEVINPFYNTGIWWLRSPCHANPCVVCTVDIHGEPESSQSVNNYKFGVRPATTIVVN